MIDRDTAHQLSNFLQILMSQVELGQKDKARQTVRLIADLVNVHTRISEESKT